jgi:hypothetical protein
MLEVGRMLLPIEPACAKKLLIIPLIGLTKLSHSTIVRSIRDTSAHANSFFSQIAKKTTEKEVFLHIFLYVRRNPFLSWFSSRTEERK